MGLYSKQLTHFWSCCHHHHREADSQRLHQPDCTNITAYLWGGLDGGGGGAVCSHLTSPVTDNRCSPSRILYTLTTLCVCVWEGGGSPPKPVNASCQRRSLSQKQYCGGVSSSPDRSLSSAPVFTFHEMENDVRRARPRSERRSEHLPPSTALTKAHSLGSGNFPPPRRSSRLIHHTPTIEMSTSRQLLRQSRRAFVCLCLCFWRCNITASSYFEDTVSGKPTAQRSC